jgi:hypothetical protein
VRFVGLCCCLVLLSGRDARGEIEKVATTRENQICFYWWPKISAVPGWHLEPDASLSFGSNAIAPDGSTFADAEVVMYAGAIYKPRMPEYATLEQFIAGDRARFLREDPTLVVRPTASLRSADGELMKSLAFFPSKKKGNWERVTYGEEGDYYLVFTISSRSKKGFEAKQGDYESLVRSYRK